MVHNYSQWLSQKFFPGGEQKDEFWGPKVPSGSRGKASLEAPSPSPRTRESDDFP